MDVDAEIQRSRARFHYACAALCSEEARELADTVPERSTLMARRGEEHRDQARVALRLLSRLDAPLGARLEEIVAVHDLSFASELTTQKETAHEQGR